MSYFGDWHGNVFGAWWGRGPEAEEPAVARGAGGGSRQRRKRGKRDWRDQHIPIQFERSSEGQTEPVPALPLPVEVIKQALDPRRNGNTVVAQRNVLEASDEDEFMVVLAQVLLLA